MNTESKIVDARLLQVREVLLQTVSEKYQALVETINKIPMAIFKDEAIRQINSGFLWAKEGISTVNFNFDEPVTQAVPITEAERGLQYPSEESPEPKEVKVEVDAA